MAADEGFDVVTEDLETFQKNVQRASDDFRDAGFNTLAALNGFSNAAGLLESGLQGLTQFWRQHADGLTEATTRLQETALGVSALAVGANVISTSYQSGDGLGANVLNKIDSKVVNKLFAEPKQEDAADAANQGAGGANQPLIDELNRGLEEQAEKNNDANEAGIEQLEGGDSWIDSYTGATVVEVPGQEDPYVSPNENELGPDLPEIDKYDESARDQLGRELQIPPGEEVLRPVTP